MAHMEGSPNPDSFFLPCLSHTVCNTKINLGGAPKTPSATQCKARRGGRLPSSKGVCAKNCIDSCTQA